MSTANDRLQMRHCAEQVRCRWQRHPTRAFVNQGNHTGCVKDSREGIKVCQYLLGSRSFAGPTPGHDVGVVVEFGAHDSITWTQGFGNGIGHRHVVGRRVGTKTKTSRISIE